MLNRSIGGWTLWSLVPALSGLLLAPMVMRMLDRSAHQAPAPPARPGAVPARDININPNSDIPGDIEKVPEKDDFAHAWPQKDIKIKLLDDASHETLGEQFAAAVRQHRGVLYPEDLRVCGEHRLSSRRAFVAICTRGGSCFACGGGVELYDLHRMGSEVHTDEKARGDKMTAFENAPEVSPVSIGPGVPGFLVRGGTCHGGSCEETVEVFSLVELADLPEDPSLDADSVEKKEPVYTKEDRRNYHGIYKSADINITTSNTGQDCDTERCIDLNLRVSLQASRHRKYKDLCITLDGKAAILDGDALVPVHRQWVLPFEDIGYRVPAPLRRKEAE